MLPICTLPLYPNLIFIFIFLLISALLFCCSVIKLKPKKKPSKIYLLLFFFFRFQNRTTKNFTGQTKNEKRKKKETTLSHITYLFAIQLHISIHIGINNHPTNLSTNPTIEAKKNKLQINE